MLRKFNSKIKKFVIITILLSVIYLNWYLCNKEIQRIKEEASWIKQYKAGNLVKTPRIILVWNDLWGKKNWGFNLEPEIDFIKSGCSETNCVVTDQRSLLKYADAVMFHIYQYMDHPPFKLKNQRWIFLNHEPPNNIDEHKLDSWQGLFNWTMTYRLDGDIYMPYSIYYKRSQPIKMDYHRILKNKNKLVAWMVSSCDAPSKRDEYVQELSKYIPVDVYGKCAKKFGQDNVCTRKQQSDCDNILSKSYKFYLSFENCLNKDYVTEKYFHMLTLDIVPVVRGDGNYSAIGPPNSWIDTRDFKSAKDLANFLTYLDKNDEQYIKYLKWKEHCTADEKASHSEDINKDGSRLSFCSLCKKLTNPNHPIKFYNDIKQWYGYCRTSDDI